MFFLRSKCLIYFLKTLPRYYYLMLVQLSHL